jgi:RNA-directed DNA polymerase
MHFGHAIQSEAELREVTDLLYQVARQGGENGNDLAFTGLLELASSEATIVSAIHKLKSNRGAETPGVEDSTIRTYLQKPFREVVEVVLATFADYKPAPVRRVLIPKPGSRKKRPLGIPRAIDKIVQECLRMILEPICEAQFFEHSYGFRPWRSTADAVARVEGMLYQGYHWVVEGDIKGYFDNVNHNVMLQKLWNIGIRDERVLAMIKKLLKAGVMINAQWMATDLGTPQGGIISPLLANVYLDGFDWRIAKGWEHKPTKRTYTDKEVRLRWLTRRSKLKPVYLIRYADDWVLMCKTEADAQAWLGHAREYLDDRLKLALSEEKTLITDARVNPIKFVGFEISLRPGRSKSGFVNMTRPNRDRLKSKIDILRKETRGLRTPSSQEDLIHRINLLNSRIRGLVQYYELGSHTFRDFQSYSWDLLQLGWKRIRQHGGKLVPARELSNLLGAHHGRELKVPAVEYLGMKIGMTALCFTKFKKRLQFDQKLSPYTPDGRRIAREREGKKLPLLRADELLSDHFSLVMAIGAKNPRYNFEYYMNRAYAFNRDGGKCKICLSVVYSDTVEFHHVNSKLGLDKVNRVPNLATICKTCHGRIHRGLTDEGLNDKARKRLAKYRKIIEDQS